MWMMLDPRNPLIALVLLVLIGFALLGCGTDCTYKSNGYCYHVEL